LTFFSQELAQPSPTIVLSGCQENPLAAKSITIVLDGVTVVEFVEDITLALSCVLSTYWVFGVQYPKILNNTMVFVEHFLYGMETTKKRPVKVMRTFNMLTNVNKA